MQGEGFNFITEALQGGEGVKNGEKSVHEALAFWYNSNFNGKCLKTKFQSDGIIF